MTSAEEGQQGTGGPIQIGDSNSYYDALAERSTDAGVDAVAAAHDVEYYRKEIERLQKVQA